MCTEEHHQQQQEREDIETRAVEGAWMASVGDIVTIT